MKGLMQGKKSRVYEKCSRRVYDTADPVHRIGLGILFWGTMMYLCFSLFSLINQMK
ncbi:hypothetical protein BDW42DRAFT_90736 [Aspergillus taichungensis]|uniref:Uncharacterized protein n=1 Tax=Aspergillus taichungensis TaxID=482145 RepID=A0A2J5HWL6_9EURO|nr:hypothetical protein BDW42DRAFT_90736 [Aspergillus taichungensis]